MSKKSKFLVGGAILAGVGAIAAVVTREIKKKVSERQDVVEHEEDTQDEHMYKIQCDSKECHNNECFGYDSEEYNCQEEKKTIVEDEKDGYSDYSEN